MPINWNNKIIAGIKPYKNPTSYWPIAKSYNQYDSGIMSLSINSGTGGLGFNPVVVAANTENYGIIKGYYNDTGLFYDGKNSPEIQKSDGFIVGGYNSNQWSIIAFRPTTPWLVIRKIKVYTNIIYKQGVSNTQVRLQGAGGYNYYNTNYDLDQNPTTSNVGEFLSNGPGYSGTLMEFQLNNIIAGTAATASSIYTSANIGDPGTIWGEKVAFSDNYSNVSLDSTTYKLEGTFIGNKTLGTVPYPYTSWRIPQNTPVEKFYTSYISFQMWPLSYTNYGNIPDLKFRFVIEYETTSSVYE